MQRTFSVGLASIAMLLFVGAGCSAVPVEETSDVAEGDAMEQSEAVFPAEGEPIRVGVIGPFSGDAAIYGDPMKKMVQLAEEDLNNAGGIAGHPVEMVFQDGKCSGKDSTLAMQQLVNIEGVKLVIGGFCSSESLAAAPIANENKVLLFSPGSSSPDLTEQGGEFFLRNYPSDAFQGVVLAEGAVNKKGWKRIAVAQEQTDYATALSRTFENTAKELGAEVMVEQFTSQETDFRTILTKFKSEEADALLLSVQTPQIADLILKQAQELNWKVGVIGADVFTGSDVPKKHADYLVGNMIMAEFSYDAESDAFKKMVEDYNKKFGQDPDFLTYMQTVYDAVAMLGDAVEEVGTDAESVRTWLLSSEGWTGVSGEVAFTPEGDRKAGHDLKTLDAEGNVVLFVE